MHAKHGAPVDHTLLGKDGGWFLHLKPSGEREKQVYLDIPMGMASNCRLQFWYYVPLPNEPALSIELHQCNKAEPPTVLWWNHIDGNSDSSTKTWKHGVVNVPLNNRARIRIVGLVHDDAGVSLDDLSLDCIKGTTITMSSVEACQTRCVQAGFEVHRFSTKGRCTCQRPLHDKV